MKFNFLYILIVTTALLFGSGVQAAFYGLCCPEKCPEGQEAQETSTDNCECTCTSGEDVQLSNDSKICCEGSRNVSTGEVDENCCINTGGVYVASGGTMGEPAACCAGSSTSKDIEGALNATCCKNAGGKMNNGKCCRQSPQGS